MSVIENLRRVIGNDTPDHTYECKSCGHPFELQRQVCPSCGGFSVERVDWSDRAD